MKKFVFCFSLILGSSITQLHAQSSSAQLSTQKSSALAAHLTTRIEWQSFPKPIYSNDDLEGRDRAAILRIAADESGHINKVKIQESTGSKKLDKALIEAVEHAKTKPFQQDGTPLPIIGYQTFTLNLKRPELAGQSCIYHFDSKNWHRQQAGKSTSFRYLQQPSLDIDREKLKGKDRLVRFNFKVNKQGNVSKVSIEKGSGIYALDAQVMQSISKAQVEVPKRLWFFRKSNLSDEIYFKLDECPVN